MKWRIVEGTSVWREDVYVVEADTEDEAMDRMYDDEPVETTHQQYGDYDIEVSRIDD